MFNNFLRKHWVLLCVVTVSILLLINAALIFNNSLRLGNQNELKEDIFTIIDNVNGLEYAVIHGLDIGLRGYALTKEEKMLEIYDFAHYFSDTIFHRLYHLSEKIDYPPNDIDSLKVIIEGYRDQCIYMKSLVDQDSLETFRAILAEDPGSEVWHNYNAYRQNIFIELENQRDRLDLNIESDFQNNLIIQLVIILLSVPSIIFIFFHLNRLQNNLQTQYDELKNSRDFLSHIIRGPICRLVGLFNLLKNDSMEDKEEVTERIERVAHEIDSLTKSDAVYVDQQKNE